MPQYFELLLVAFMLLIRLLTTGSSEPGIKSWFQFTRTLAGSLTRSVMPHQNGTSSFRRSLHLQRHTMERMPFDSFIFTHHSGRHSSPARWYSGQQWYSCRPHREQTWYPLSVSSPVWPTKRHNPRIDPTADSAFSFFIRSLVRGSRWAAAAHAER